jgi:Co/Zn/Cd efflux system component
VNEGSTRAIVAAFLANLGIAIAKFVAFLFTGAASMLAESIHSVADSGNQALLALGGRSGRRAPTPEHPFGFGRERYFWAFLVAVVLFTLGSLFALCTRPTRCGLGNPGGRSSAAPRARSCRSCCWKTWGRCLGWPARWSG